MGADGHDTTVIGRAEMSPEEKIEAAQKLIDEARAEIAAKDKKILALRAESKMKDDAIQKIERQLQEANECRDPAYFAQIGRKRR